MSRTTTLRFEPSGDGFSIVDGCGTTVSTMRRVIRDAAAPKSTGAG
jgi:hypothetical protein